MKVRSIVLSVAIVGAGAAIAAALVASAPQPERTQVEDRRTPVTMTVARPGSRNLIVSGMGTVNASRRVEVYAEVGGRVTAAYDGLVEGAYIVQGTPLVRVDARDYKYAVDTAKASLAQARAQLEEERKRTEVAERDLELIDRASGKKPPPPSNPETDLSPKGGRGRKGQPEFADGDFARRVPQLQSAQANLRSVRSQLKSAKLQVGRTKIIAPFDAVVVVDERVEIGQLVSPATPLATLVGTDLFHVRVAVPVDSLNSIRIPGTNSSAEVGARATIVQEVGSETVRREGYVVRLLGELQEEGRMAQLIVAVEDPFELSKDPEARALPLLLGSYVRVEIEGATIENVVEIPRAALRERETIWVIDGADELEVRTVEVAWRGRDTVLIRAGLFDGERVVTSRLAVPLPKMPLRIVDSGDGPEGGE